jgi:small subunit ribosomal protein S6
VKSYEAVCVFHPNTAEEKITSVISKIEAKISSLGGTVLKTDKWGMKRLAVSPKNSRTIKEGYYVAVYFDSDPSVPAQVTNIFTVTEDVLRFMISLSQGAPIPAAAAAPETEGKVEISPSMLGAQ